jgi:hypothetical protein
MSFSRSVSRQRKTRPDLYAEGDCIKVRLFVSVPARYDLLLREGSKPHSRDAPRLGSYVDGPRLARIGWGYGDRIVCAHMSGLR